METITKQESDTINQLWAKYPDLKTHGYATRLSPLDLEIAKAIGLRDAGLSLEYRNDTGGVRIIPEFSANIINAIELWKSIPSDSTPSLKRVMIGVVYLYRARIATGEIEFVAESKNPAMAICLSFLAYHEWLIKARQSDNGIFCD